MPELSIDPSLHDAMALVAPGTQLREALDMIIAARTGALITIGDVKAVDSISNGGFDIDAPFSAQRLFELAKMDGAITLDEGVTRIRRASIHLSPDPTLETAESGTRHRTAERVSRQTDALVISVSARRGVISLYRNGNRLLLESTELLLSRADQALQTLQNYRTRLDESLIRLSLLEFEDLVTAGDVAEALRRLGMLHRIHREVERYIERLGTDGRLIRMQSDEMIATIADTERLIIRDYAADRKLTDYSEIVAALEGLDQQELFEDAPIMRVLGHDQLGSAEEPLHARGFRVLSRVSTLPATVVSRIVERFGSPFKIAQATVEDLDEVDGVSQRRARAMASAIKQMRASLR